jgi:hypothetical protein
MLGTQETSCILIAGLLERDIFDLFLPEFDKTWVSHLRETCCYSTNLCTWRPNTIYKNRSVHRHQGWRRSFYYQADQAPPEKKYGLRSFVDGPAEVQDSWGVMDDSTINAECQLLSHRVSKLVFDGLTGVDTIHCWISRRI